MPASSPPVAVLETPDEETPLWLWVRRSTASEAGSAASSGADRYTKAQRTFNALKNDWLTRGVDDDASASVSGGERRLMAAHAYAWVAITLELMGYFDEVVGLPRRSNPMLSGTGTGGAGGSSVSPCPVFVHGGANDNNHAAGGRSPTHDGSGVGAGTSGLVVRDAGDSSGDLFVGCDPPPRARDAARQSVSATAAAALLQAVSPNAHHSGDSAHAHARQLARAFTQPQHQLRRDPDADDDGGARVSVLALAVATMFAVARECDMSEEAVCLLEPELRFLIDVQRAQHITSATLRGATTATAARTSGEARMVGTRDVAAERQYRRVALTSALFTLQSGNGSATQQNPHQQQGTSRSARRAERAAARGGGLPSGRMAGSSVPSPSGQTPAQPFAVPGANESATSSAAASMSVLGGLPGASTTAAATTDAASVGSGGNAYLAVGGDIGRSARPHPLASPFGAAGARQTLGFTPATDFLAEHAAHGAPTLAGMQRSIVADGVAGSWAPLRLRRGVNGRHGSTSPAAGSLATTVALDGTGIAHPFRASVSSPNAVASGPLSPTTVLPTSSPQETHSPAGGAATRRSSHSSSKRTSAAASPGGAELGGSAADSATRATSPPPSIRRKPPATTTAAAPAAPAPARTQSLTNGSSASRPDRRVSTRHRHEFARQLGVAVTALLLAGRAVGPTSTLVLRSVHHAADAAEYRWDAAPRVLAAVARQADEATIGESVCKAAWYPATAPGAAIGPALRWRLSLPLETHFRRLIVAPSGLVGASDVGVSLNGSANVPADGGDGLRRDTTSLLTPKSASGGRRRGASGASATVPAVAAGAIPRRTSSTAAVDAAGDGSAPLPQPTEDAASSRTQPTVRTTAAKYRVNPRRRMSEDDENLPPEERDARKCCAGGCVAM